MKLQPLVYSDWVKLPSIGGHISMQSLDSPMSWEYSGRLITTVFSSLAKLRILTTSRLLTELSKPDGVPLRTSRKVVKWPRL